MSTRERIVKLGKEYIQTHGYHSFNYKQISTRLNIQNAAVHYYFPSKENLGVAVITQDKEEFTNHHNLYNQESATVRLEALIKMYEGYFSNGKKLCLIGTFGSVYHDICPEIQEATADYLKYVIQWLTQIFEQGRDEGEFVLSGTAEEMANTWITALTGSLQLGRIRGKIYFDEAINNLRDTAYKQK